MRSAHTGTRHRLRWSPESRIGRWTVALAGASVVGLVLLGVGFATGALESAASFSENWFLTAWGVGILATGAGSAVAGALAIGRHHDRAEKQR